MKYRAVVLAAFLVALSGCGSRPRAPAILDEPVYQNDREGFRFLAPPGWTQQTRAELPPGKLEQERLLVVYTQQEADSPADLEVAAVDLPEPTDLTAYVSAAPHGVKHWRLMGKPETVKINGVSGVRTVLTGQQGSRTMTKEVVTFRRGERVFLFTGFYVPSDSKSRDAVRQAVGGVMWKG
jgi:hypothetical protein